MGIACGMYRGEQKCTVLWLGNLKRPLGRPRHRLKDNIKIDLTERVWETS